jgi:Cof subfamily protein (haloacid dehalogenase superfamily)
MRLRLLALDLDGTILDPYGRLTGGVREAVDAARRRGLRVVLCTGRRFRRALPAARELELTGSIVVHNGAVVKDIESGRTEVERYLPADLYAEVLATLRETGSPLVYVDRYHEGTDILTERRDRAHLFQNEYLDDNAEFTRVVDDLAERPRRDVIMMSAMANLETLERLRSRASDRFGDRVSTHLLMNKVYRGYILEFLSPRSGKWSALRTIADHLGVAPEEIAAIGDDDNDVEMIREAGLGIAMGNAVEAARAAADVVVRSNAEGGVVGAIERVLLEA